ncbi:MAG: hypothetical protein AB7N76_09170 [Planctomycetota bacterium]
MLSVVARAEVRVEWDEVLARLRERLPARRFLVPRLGPAELAWIELAPADPVELELSEGLLQLEARTGAWGPGYHQQVVRLVDELGDALPAGWASVEDATGHHASRSRPELERAFLRRAHALWDPDLALSGPAVGLALGEGPARVPAGTVATPLGFRSAAWIRRTREELRRALHASGAPQRAAREAFLWWCPEPDAFDWVQLGRALCTCDVIWRPLGADAAGDGVAEAPEQVEMRERAFECFAAALRLDPDAPVPWPELLTLAELLGHPAPSALGAPGDPGAPGDRYREGWVRRALGGWTMALPGWLRAGCDEAGGERFWDERLEVNLSAPFVAEEPFVVEREAARHLAALPRRLAERARTEPLNQGGVSGYALVVEGALVQGQVEAEGERVAFSAVLRDPAARELALRLVRSLTPQRAPSRALPA